MDEKLRCIVTDHEAFEGNNYLYSGASGSELILSGKVFSLPGKRIGVNQYIFDYQFEGIIDGNYTRISGQGNPPLDCLHADGHSGFEGFDVRISDSDPRSSLHTTYEFKCRCGNSWVMHDTNSEFCDVTGQTTDEYLSYPSCELGFQGVELANIPKSS